MMPTITWIFIRANQKEIEVKFTDHRDDVNPVLQRRTHNVMQEECRRIYKLQFAVNLNVELHMIVKFVILIHMKDVWLCILTFFTLGVHVAFKIKIALTFSKHLKSRASSKPARGESSKSTVWLHFVMAFCNWVPRLVIKTLTLPDENCFMLFI